jgi:hypothetical protein
MDIRYNLNDEETNKLIDNIDIESRIKSSTIPTTMLSNDLDLNWINGITTNDLFSILKPIDREILLLYYINGLNDTMIAKKLRYSYRETITRRRIKAIERIEQYGKDHKLFRLWKRDNIYNQEVEEMSRLQPEDGLQYGTTSKHSFKAGVFSPELVR